MRQPLSELGKSSASCGTNVAGRKEQRSLELLTLKDSRCASRASAARPRSMLTTSLNVVSLMRSFYSVCLLTLLCSGFCASRATVTRLGARGSTCSPMRLSASLSVPASRNWRGVGGHNAVLGAQACPLLQFALSYRAMTASRCQCALEDLNHCGNSQRKETP